MVSFLPLFLLSQPLLARQAHLTLLFTGDQHGQLEPLKGEDPSRPVGGAARRMALIQKIRKEVGVGKVLLVDTGDLFTGTALSGLTRGEADCAAYQLMGYDAMALGEHDFEYGKKAIIEYRKRFRLPWVSANAVVPQTSQNFVRPYALRMAGIRVGLVGFSHPDTFQWTRRGAAAGLAFPSPSASAKGLHTILKKDAEVFIALSRLGPEGDRKFAASNPFYQVIVGTGSANPSQEPWVSKDEGGSPVGPLVVQAGSRGLYLGRLDLTVAGTKKKGYRVTDYHYRAIPLTSDLPEEPRMTSLLATYKSQMKSDPEEVLATLGAVTVKTGGGVPLLGQAVVDSMREAAQAEAALFDSGRFRSIPPSGSLTREGLYEAYPYDDEAVTGEVSGRTLLKVLERSAEEKGTGAFLWVSGIQADSTGGRRKFTLNGEPLQEKRKYKVVLNDFLAGGGEGYDEFRHVPFEAADHPKVRDLLEKSLKAKGKISLP